MAEAVRASLPRRLALALLRRAARTAARLAAWLEVGAGQAPAEDASLARLRARFPDAPEAWLRVVAARAVGFAEMPRSPAPEREEAPGQVRAARVVLPWPGGRAPVRARRGGRAASPREVAAPPPRCADPSAPGMAGGFAAPKAVPFPPPADGAPAATRHTDPRPADGAPPRLLPKVTPPAEPVACGTAVRPNPTMPRGAAEQGEDVGARSPLPRSLPHMPARIRPAIAPGSRTGTPAEVPPRGRAGAMPASRADFPCLRVRPVVGRPRPPLPATRDALAADLAPAPRHVFAAHTREHAVQRPPAAAPAMAATWPAPPAVPPHPAAPPPAPSLWPALPGSFPLAEAAAPRDPWPALPEPPREPVGDILAWLAGRERLRRLARDQAAP